MATAYVDLINDLKKHEIQFRLSPGQLNGFRNDAALSWTRVRFEAPNVKSIPDERGVYAFVVASDSPGLPTHGYVMYIGKSGDGKHSLKKRYRDYLGDQKRPKRPRVHRMLNLWKDALFFFYAPITGAALSLTTIEQTLNDAFLPPMCRNDFSAGVRAAINAFPT